MAISWLFDQTSRGAGLDGQRFEIDLARGIVDFIDLWRISGGRISRGSIRIIGAWILGGQRIVCRAREFIAAGLNLGKIVGAYNSTVDGRFSKSGAGKRESSCHGQHGKKSLNLHNNNPHNILLEHLTLCPNNASSKKELRVNLIQWERY